MEQDLLLKQTEQGFFDLEIGEHDFTLASGLETTVAVLLFTDARAAPEQISDVEKRRGWVGNVLRSRELGGMLWLIAQARNDQQMRNRIQGWAYDSLQPLITDGLATGVVVVVSEEVDSVRGIKLSINIIVNGESKNFDLWLTTDLGNLTNVN